MESADVLHRQGNVAIVQLHGRQYPAIAFQGDSMRRVRDSLHRAITIGDPAEREDELRSVLEELDAAIGQYAEVLKFRGMNVPW